PLGDLSFFADNLGEAIELLGDRLIHADDLVEEAGDLAIHSVDVFRKADAEVTATQCPKSTDELAAIDKVPLRLNVHSTLRSALPPPGYKTCSPPAARTIRKQNSCRFLNEQCSISSLRSRVAKARFRSLRAVQCSVEAASSLSGEPLRRPHAVHPVELPVRLGA